MSSILTCPLTGPKKIVVATDGSAHSERALVEAMQLSGICATKLYVVSVVEVNPEYETIAPNLVEQEENRIREHVEQAKAAIGSHGISYEIIMHRDEDPATCIVEDARKVGADMIVLGKHGTRKGLKRLIMGSVAEKVIAGAPCSVLVVRA